MQVATFEGVMATASENLAAPFLPLYAYYLGASSTQIGLLTALPALLANVLQIPAAFLAERWRRRKLMCVAGIASQRLPFVAVAALPFFLGGQEALAAFMALLCVRAGLGSAATPAWTSLMADLTPRRLRGTYFANRNILCNVAALAAALGAAVVMRFLGEPAGYQVVFALAGILGGIGAYAFLRFPDFDSEPRRHGRAPGRPPGRRAVPEPENKRLSVPATGGAHRGANLRHALEAVKAERRFLAFTLSSFLWGFGVTLPQPLFAVYFVDELGGTAGMWGLVSGASIVATILGQRYWGPLADRLGGKQVMAVSGIFCGMIPLWWVLAQAPGHGYIINLLGGYFWAGYNLAAFNLLLEVTPDEHRTTFVAGYNGLVGVSHFLGPLIGGIVADYTGIEPVMLVSAALRLLGLAAFVAAVRSGPAAPFRLGDYLRWPGHRVRRHGPRRQRERSPGVQRKTLNPETFNSQSFSPLVRCSRAAYCILRSSASCSTEARV